MSGVPVSAVKSLREKTGAGMVDCKNALVEANGDEAAAVEVLRKKGIATADKKAGRVTAEGAVGSVIAMLILGAIETERARGQAAKFCMSNLGYADVTLTADADVFRAILDGEMNATMAFMTGKLAVDGSMGMAMKLGSVLG